MIDILMTGIIIGVLVVIISFLMFIWINIAIIKRDVDYLSDNAHENLKKEIVEIVVKRYNDANKLKEPK